MYPSITISDTPFISNKEMEISPYTKRTGNGGVYRWYFILEVGGFCQFQTPDFYSHHPLKNR
jgi:hypothetical protein